MSSMVCGEPANEQAQLQVALSKAQQEYMAAYQDYERKHRVWMNTSIFVPQAFEKATAEKDAASREYVAKRKVWEELDRKAHNVN